MSTCGYWTDEWMRLRCRTISIHFKSSPDTRLSPVGPERSIKNKKHLRAASKLTQLRSVCVVLRKLAVTERLAPPRLRTSAASAEETTPTAGRWRAPLLEPQRNPVSTYRLWPYPRCFVWGCSSFITYTLIAQRSLIRPLRVNHRWRSSLLLLMSSAGLFENWKTAWNICCVSSGRLKWKAECDSWCVVTGKRHFKYGCFKSPIYREYQCQVFDTQSEVMEIHHRPSYVKPTQTCASFCTDKQILQIDEGAIWLQDVAFQTN